LYSVYVSFSLTIADNQRSGPENTEPEPQSIAQMDFAFVSSVISNDPELKLSAEQPVNPSGETRTSHGPESFQGPTSNRHAYRHALFPALLRTTQSDTERILYNTRTAILIDKVPKVGKDTHKKQSIASIISSILSREQQSSLPAV
jgi:hypothetical protein